MGDEASDMCGRVQGIQCLEPQFKQELKTNAFYLPFLANQFSTLAFQVGKLVRPLSSSAYRNAYKAAESAFYNARVMHGMYSLKNMDVSKFTNELVRRFIEYSKQRRQKANTRELRVLSPMFASYLPESKVNCLLNFDRCREAMEGGVYVLTDKGTGAKQVILRNGNVYAGMGGQSNQVLQGILVTNNGLTVGTFEDGQAKGKVYELSPTQSAFYGRISGGQRTEGILLYNKPGEKGSFSYIGQLKRNKANGSGVYQAEGVFLAGLFLENNVVCGAECSQYAIYIGQFKNSMRQGLGLLYLPQEQVAIQGKFKDGLCVRVSSLLKTQAIV